MKRRIGSLTVGLVVGTLAVALALGSLRVRDGSGRRSDANIAAAVEGAPSETTFVYSTMPGGTNGDNSELFVTTSSQEAVNISNYKGPDLAPALSSDGRQVAFASDRDDPGNLDIYVMNVDGSELKRVTADPATDTRPAWSPDGQRIVFARAVDDGTLELWIVTTGDGSEVQLTRNEVIDFSPDWSPDGKWIAFQRYVGTNLEIFRVAPDGLNETRLTNLPGEDRDPQWSPDGTAISFVRDEQETGTGAIFLMSAVDLEVRPIPLAVGVEIKEPAWADNGRGITFLAEGIGLNLRVETFSTDGHSILDARLPASFSQALEQGNLILGTDAL
jgi:Tol biopolymer transport system component